MPVQQSFSPTAAEVPSTHRFSLAFTREHAAVVVAIVGDLDCYTAPLLAARLEDLVENQGNLNVVLDLREMTFVDSTGLSAIIHAFRHLRERGGTMQLRRLSPSARKVMEICGLHRVLAIDPL